MGFQCYRTTIFFSFICLLCFSLETCGNNLNNYNLEFSISIHNHLCKSGDKFQLELKPQLEEGEDVLFKSSDESVYSCIELCCKSQGCTKIYFANDICFGVNLFAPNEELNYILENPPEMKFSVERKQRDLSSKNGPLDFGKKCEYGLLNCPENEFCKSFNSRRRDGICECVEGYSRGADGKCYAGSTQNPPDPTPSTGYGESSSSSNPQTGPPTSLNITTMRPSTASQSPIEKLVVSIKNKTVELEEGDTKYKSTTLSAYAIGGHGVSYTFKWTLLDKPDEEDDGSISDMNSQTISLTNLVPGVYIFKVEVTGENAYGEAAGNITVIPTKHRNKPPVAVIVPGSQRVTLPNSGVILDGSGSTDDSEIVSYHWELITGPIGYKLSEEGGKTLQLSNLLPGNFTIMLKVKDEAGLEGNSTAIVLVEKETDYPPTANAGGDKIIYLPQRETTLNGTASSDDHGITEWEWTKGPEDSGNAVDMQDTRTPYLHLSNLEEGHYHFILKVLDTAGHSANSSAHVYVQSGADNVPQANAGKNVSIVIPITTTLLDGSESTGISPQSHFLWSQISGPTNAKIASNDRVKSNVSELTRGDYVFQLTVWNGENALVNSSSTVMVSVTQDKNRTPTAKAGIDFSVTLPVSAVIVNGSESSDDIEIVKWLWERDSMSLAAGSIIKNSDHSPILLLTGVVPGRYIWNLTVWDEQGASSMDTVSIIVKDGPHHMDEVELILGVGIEALSVGQLHNLLQKLELLLHSTSEEVSITVSDLFGRPQSGETTLVLLGSSGGKVMRGPSLAHQLKAKTMTPSNAKILDIAILSVHTVVCQNNCSGHGECIQASRECRCHSWWMESSLRRHFGDGNANCDWSVVYVFVGTIGSALAMGLLLWLVATLVVRRLGGKGAPSPGGGRRKKTARYSLLEAHDEAKVKSRVPGSLLDSGSDSNTDSEILFDSRKQRLLKGDKVKNGHVKLQRIRT